MHLLWKLKLGVSKAAAVAIVVVIVIIIAGGAYAALTLEGQPGSSTTTSSGPTTTTTSTNYGCCSTTTISTQSVQNPGKIIYETSNLLSSVDPATFSDSGSQTIQFNVYENLLQYIGNSTKTVFPWLAENYTVSPDGLTYTFNLRQGITFQDGTPFNASAVVFSINRAILTDSSSSTVGLIVGTHAPGIINGSYYFSATSGVGATTYNQTQVNAFINSDGVVVGANPYQVIFHLGYADASFPYLLPLSICEIVSPSYVIAHWTPPTDGHGYVTGITAGEANPYMSNHMSGTGPYELQSWDQTTGDVVLVANSHYWGSPSNSGNAQVSTIDINFVQSDSARVLDLKSGSADIADIPTSDIFAFMNKQSWLSTHQVIPTSSDVSVYGPNAELNMYYIAWNYRILDANGSKSSFQPFQNKYFRQAMADAINISDILNNAAFGLGVKANGVIPYGMNGYNSSLSLNYNFNLTDAMGNLTIAASQLGFNSTNPQIISMVYAIGDSTGEAISSELATNINNMALGITIQVVPQTESEYVSGIVGGQTPMEAISFSLDYPDATDYLASFSSSLDIGLFVSYNNTAYLDLVNQQAGETNSTLRQILISRAATLLNQDVAYTFLFYPTVFGQTGQMMRSWLHGFVFNAAFPGPYFYQFTKS
jgi:peptide/nickel transport system substrate-binding protein